MSISLKNIVKWSVTGFLLIAISGLTIAIHHEHALGNDLAEREHGPSDGLVVKTTPHTYHEVHILKLFSGDSFNGCPKMEFKQCLTKLFVGQLEPSALSSIHQSTTIAGIDIKETGPPSRDKCVLFCRFLI